MRGVQGPRVGLRTLRHGVGGPFPPKGTDLLLRHLQLLLQLKVLLLQLRHRGLPLLQPLLQLLHPVLPLLHMPVRLGHELQQLLPAKPGGHLGHVPPVVLRHALCKTGARATDKSRVCTRQPDGSHRPRSAPTPGSQKSTGKSTGAAGLSTGAAAAVRQRLTGGTQPPAASALVWGRAMTEAYNTATRPLSGADATPVQEQMGRLHIDSVSPPLTLGGKIARHPLSEGHAGEWGEVW